MRLATRQKSTAINRSEAINHQGIRSSFWWSPTQVLAQHLLCVDLWSDKLVLAIGIRATCFVLDLIHFTVIRFKPVIAYF